MSDMGNRDIFFFPDFFDLSANTIMDWGGD